jgi:hypothetical protein
LAIALSDTCLAGRCIDHCQFEAAPAHLNYKGGAPETIVTHASVNVKPTFE